MDDSLKVIYTSTNNFSIQHLSINKIIARHINTYIYIYIASSPGKMDSM